MLNVHCVVFDIDDTLFLERDYIRSGFSAVEQWLKAHQVLGGFADQALAEFHSGARGDIFDRALLQLGVAIEPALVQAMVRVYRTHAPDIRLLPDAAQVLDALTGKTRLAIVSDGPEASQKAKVEALALRKWCEPIILTESLGAGFGKPHTKAFEIVQEKASCDGGSCVYVADNPRKDFQGPKKLGWRTMRVRREGALHASLPSGSDVDIEISDMEPLANFLKELG